MDDSTHQDISAVPFFRHLPLTGGSAVTDRTYEASGPGGATIRKAHLVLGCDGLGNEIAIDADDPAYLSDLIRHARRCQDWLTGWTAA